MPRTRTTLPRERRKGTHMTLDTLSARKALDGEISEAAFQALVIDTAHLFGWRVAHFRPARTDKGWRTPVEADGKGFPDLVCLRWGRQIVVELKSERGVASIDQLGWLGDFSRAGIETHVWRPSDWSSGRIEAVLRGEEAER